jgi:hypothetical protein
MPVLLQGLDPRVLAALKKIQADALARGIQTNILSAFRTRKDQEELYANYQAGQMGQPLPFPDRGAVPLAARPGTSPHEKGFAFDLQATDPSRQSELWSLAPSSGLKALGMRDPAHFELADGGGAAPVAVGSFAGVNSSARGMRNNNPGNLESNAWTQGLPGYRGSDGRFAIFDTPEHGMAALDQNLASYGQKGVNTPFAVASRWAPASDNNNPNSYGATIAKGLGVGLNDTIDLNDPAVRAKIATSIATVENGPGGASVSPVASSASASSNPANPTDWQSLLGAEAPPGDTDLGSLLGSAAGSLGQPSTPSTGGAGVKTALPPAPMTDFSFAPIEDSPETLGARYAQNKEARKLSPLGQLFTIKTIGQPGGKPPNPYSGGIG